MFPHLSENCILCNMCDAFELHLLLIFKHPICQTTNCKKGLPKSVSMWAKTTTAPICARCSSSRISTRRDKHWRNSLKTSILEQKGIKSRIFWGSLRHGLWQMCVRHSILATWLAAWHLYWPVSESARSCSTHCTTSFSIRSSEAVRNKKKNVLYLCETAICEWESQDAVLDHELDTLSYQQAMDSMYAVMAWRARNHHETMQVSVNTSNTLLEDKSGFNQSHVLSKWRYTNNLKTNCKVEPPNVFVYVMSECMCNKIERVEISYTYSSLLNCVHVFLFCLDGLHCMKRVRGGSKWAKSWLLEIAWTTNNSI